MNLFKLLISGISGTTLVVGSSFGIMHSTGFFNEKGNLIPSKDSFSNQKNNEDSEWNNQVSHILQVKIEGFFNQEIEKELSKYKGKPKQFSDSGHIEYLKVETDSLIPTTELGRDKWVLKNWNNKDWTILKFYFRQGSCKEELSNFSKERTWVEVNEKGFKKLRKEIKSQLKMMKENKSELEEKEILQNVEISCFDKKIISEFNNFSEEIINPTKSSHIVQIEWEGEINSKAKDDLINTLSLYDISKDSWKLKEKFGGIQTRYSGEILNLEKFEEKPFKSINKLFFTSGSCQQESEILKVKDLLTEISKNMKIIDESLGEDNGRFWVNQNRKPAHLQSENVDFSNNRNHKNIKISCFNRTS
ncbi:hypothetical protein [Mycoplasma parvum]|uniref:Uncharacterized protein n=1 Tax=Mycoplasma parvum str. Indiana TaxID=1403316 RepID=U5NGE5_9MOLU|nr:hypothetical protein [Mycoplasma parvum]AGX89274.1 hypothetical protein PRV_02735 [Mycoplasma parvum str. Indiana]